MQPATVTITYRDKDNVIHELKDIAVDADLHDEKTLRRHLKRFRPTAQFVSYKIELNP